MGRDQTGWPDISVVDDLPGFPKTALGEPVLIQDEAAHQVSA